MTNRPDFAKVSVGGEAMGELGLRDLAARALANVSGAQSYTGTYSWGENCVGIVTTKEARTRREIIDEVFYLLKEEDLLSVENFYEILRYIFEQEKTEAFSLDEVVLYFPSIPDTYV